MAMFPNIETIMLQITQSLGVGELQTVQKQRFKKMEKKLSEHGQTAIDLLIGIIDTICDLPAPDTAKKIGPSDQERLQEAINGFAHTFEEFMQFHTAISNGTRVFGHEQKMINWLMMSDEIIPSIARKYGFWSLAKPLAPDMPDHDLWFLPRPDNKDPQKLLLPVQIITNWWLDLISFPHEEIWNDEDAATKIRNLHNWRTGKTPTLASLKTSFHPSIKFKYRGAFTTDEQATQARQFEDAVNFVRHTKRLDEKTLSGQLPTFSQQELSEILSNNASDETKLHFVEAVRKRWAVPNINVVRRRFVLARMLQDGFERLVTHLTPGVSPTEPNPLKNKSLQLISLFETTYSLTLKAEEGSRSEQESNQRFRKLVPDWLANRHLKSIMIITGNESDQLIGSLTSKFHKLENDQALPDLFIDGSISSGPSDTVVNPITEKERSELESILSSIWDSIEKKVQDKVAPLMQRGRNHPRANEYQGDLNYLEGRHQLCLNNFERAKELFDQAFIACTEVSHGALTKEIAYACLGYSAAFGSFDQKTEKYFRRIAISLTPQEVGRLGPSRPEELDILFRDTAVRASEYFRSDLYRPYEGIDPVNWPAEQSSLPVFKQFFKIALHQEWQKFSSWFKSHKDQIERRIPDTRGDSFVTALQKLSYQSLLIERQMPTVLPESPSSLVKQGLKLMAQELNTKTLEMADFKRQTPLMLACDHGDTALVKVLLDKGVDRDAQDIVGRTALHSSAAARNTECFIMLLDRGANPAVKTVDGMSALHTAVKFGVVEAVRATLDRYQARFSADDLNDIQNQLDFVRTNYDDFRRYVASEGRKLPPKIAYKTITGIFQEYAHNASNLEPDNLN
ncbi:MAG: ankyrin repeat domain-containing protein [Thalassospira sp.]|uniref:ankyrin repeat domain-containing protein n=1 Tax=Thalassospira sp. TaxID=1912094 RepID=UPI0032EC8D6C